MIPEFKKPTMPALPGLPRLAKVLALLLIAALMLLALVRCATADSETSEGAPGGGLWQRIETPNGGSQLSLQGVLMPLRSMDITPPAVGRLQDVAVAWGDRVAAGQLLGRVHSSELAAQLREAEAAFLRLQPEAESDANPRTSAEVRAAQRRHQSALRDLAAARTREAESRTLFDKGYVARTEFEQSSRDVETLASTVEDAAEEVRRVQRQWLPGQLRARSLDRTNAKARLADLQARTRQLTLTAPIAGVVMYPLRPEGRDGGPVPELKDGAPVTGNETVMTIGDTSSYVVRVQAGEGDVHWLRKGLPARVEIGALRGQPISATVHRVAALARNSNNPLAPPEFEVEVRLPADGAMLSNEQTAVLRMGTAAQVQIPRPGPETLVQLPIGALQWNDNGGAMVRVRTASGAVEQRPVKLSRAEAERAFVSEGVGVGEDVWIPTAVGDTSADRRRPGLLQRLFGDTDEE